MPVTPNRVQQPIATWTPGDVVQGFAFMRRKDIRQDRAGNDYFDLELVDASGSINAKVWSDSRAAAAAIEPLSYVKVRGQVVRYREQPQLKVDQIRLATDADRAEGFDESRLVPSTKEDLDDLERRLRAVLEGVERPLLRRLAEETLVEYGERMRIHPAAKSIHHAFRGGLLEHVVSMMELAAAVAAHYRELDRDLLFLGVLFHDLGKLDELSPMPATDYTPAGRLVGHIVIGRDLLRERAHAIPDFPAELLLALEHLVLSHQGELEYGSPVQPMTAEAVALHAIDDLDSKLAQLRGLVAGNAAPGAGASFVYHRPFERFVYLPSAGEEEREAEAEVAGEAASTEET